MKRRCWRAFLFATTCTILGSCAAQTPPTTEVSESAEISSQESVDDDEIIRFADPIIEAFARAALSRPTGPIMAKEALSLTEMGVVEPELEDGVISTLADLRHFPNLEVLRLNGSPYGLEIADFSGLESLKELRELRLERSNITDLSPLADMKSLQTLDIFNCKVTDLSPLSGLTELESLRAGSNGGAYTDLSPLAELTKIKSLHMTNHGVTDISPLAAMNDLEYISFTDNEIADISSLIGKTELSYIALAKNAIQDIEPLFSLSNVEYIDISDNPIDSDQEEAFYYTKTLWSHTEEKTLGESGRTLRFVLEGSAVEFGTRKIAERLRIEDAKSGNVIQTIELDMYVSNRYSPYLKWEDVNFDGYWDFGIQNQDDISAYYEDPTWWQWDPDKSQFESATEFNQLHYVILDPIRKEVLSGDREGWYWHKSDVHRYVEGELLLMESEIRVLSNDMDYQTALQYTEAVCEHPPYPSYYYVKSELFQRIDGQVQLVSSGFSLYGTPALEGDYPEEGDFLGFFDASSEAGRRFDAEWPSME